MEITFVYRGIKHSAGPDQRPGHPAHNGFQECIGADAFTIDLSSSVFDATFVGDAIPAAKADYPESDVFVLENVNSLFAEPFIRRQHPNATVIFLAGHGVFGLDSYDHSQNGFTKSAVRIAERWANHRVVMRLCNRVDGILAISEYTANYLRGRIDIPVEAVYPYIQPAVYEDLKSRTPDLNSQTVTVVCEHRDHKGVDLAVDAWSEVRLSHPGAELHLIGDGHPDHYGNVPGVSVCGYVDDLTEKLSSASVLLHPARHDAFGVSVVEAMALGLVPIVTETTGAAEAVADVDTALTVNADSDDIAEAVDLVLRSDADCRQDWSQTSMDVATAYTAGTQLSKFESTFERLVDNVQ